MYNSGYAGKILRVDLTNQSTKEQRARELSDRPLVYIRGTGRHATHSMSAGWPGETQAGDV
jgi:aldehyde:ferredoxin oxidoreductase